MSTWMKDRQVAEFFHVSTKTVHRWVQRGMPRVREGAVVLYVLEDCEAWLRGRAQHAPAPEVPAPARRGPGRPRRAAEI